jgi:hypothetical protein
VPVLLDFFRGLLKPCPTKICQLPHWLLLHKQAVLEIVVERMVGLGRGHTEDLISNLPIGLVRILRRLEWRQEIFSPAP